MTNNSQADQDSLPNRLKTFAGRFACATLATSLRQLQKSIDMRIAYYDPSVDPARVGYNEHCVFVLWHENLAILLPQWHRSPVAMLVSQHRDASWLKYMADLFGFNVVRGSSTRGGAEAIRQLKKMKTQTSFAITPDGPKGPRREMTMGSLFLSSRLQMPIVPVGIGFDRPYRLDTWDKFALPRPFSRARIVFGPKIHLDRNLGRSDLEQSSVAMGELLAQLNDFATDWATTGKQLMQQVPFARARRCLQLEFHQPISESDLMSHTQSALSVGRKAA